MSSYSLLHFTDPRLQIRVSEARANDVMTRSALRILDDASAAPVDQVLSAPALGLPVRCLSVRKGADLYLLLNPSISAASDFHLNRSETCIHTGPIRRHVWRPKKVTLSATYLTGNPFEMQFEDHMAIAIQQAIQQMDNPNLFDWITPFHRSWVISSNEIAKARCDRINKALHDAPEDTADPAQPLQMAGNDRVQMRDDHGAPIAQIDMMNPILPVAPRDLRCLGVLFAVSAMRRVLTLSPEFFALSVSALAMLPALQIHHRTEDWPQNATDALGLAGAIHKAKPQPVTTSPENTADKFDAILTAADHPVLNDPTAMRQLARGLTGRGGVMLICAPEPVSTLEDHLRAVFPILYVVETPDAGMIYVATKERLDLSAAWSRLINLSAHTGISQLVQAGSEGWFEVLNSGDRLKT